jgi:type I restriction enzyme S subunit
MRARNLDLKIPQDRLVGVFKGEGMTPARDRVRGESVERCKIVRPGAFAYNPMRLNIGSIARWHGSAAAIVSPDYVVFEVDPARLDGGFLDHLRASQPWRSFTEGAGDGGVRIRIYFDHLAEFRFPLPPLSEQRRIAEILSSVDEAIQATQAVIEQTRKVKDGVLERLLTTGIGHTRFKQTVLGEIPESWTVRSLEEIASIERGRFSVRPRNDPRYFGGSIPFVQTGDIVAADGLLTCHSQTLNDDGLSVSKLFRAGTILITIAANIGNTAITTYPVCCPDSVVGIQPAEGVDVDWLRAFLVTKQADLDRQATRNAQKNINLQHLRPIQVQVPGLEEQAEIGARIRDMASSSRASSTELVRLIALKSALMTDLLAGRRRVSADLPLAAE